MKIVDVLSEDQLPGVSTIASWKQKAKQKTSALAKKFLSPQDKRLKEKLAKQNQKKWYAAVKRKQRQGIDMNNKDIYRKELHKFVSGNKKLKLDRELTMLIGKGELSDQNILDIMNKTIDARIAAKKKQADQAAAAGGAA